MEENQRSWKERAVGAALFGVLLGAMMFFLLNMEEEQNKGRTWKVIHLTNEVEYYPQEPDMFRLFPISQAVAGPCDEPFVAGLCFYWLGVCDPDPVGTFFANSRPAGLAY